MKRLFLVLAEVAGIAVLVIFAATMLDTDLRPAPDSAPGYRIVQVPTPSRDRDIEVHIWYPTATAATSTLFGQNALFYGFHAIADAEPVAKSLPILLISHGSGGNAERLGWLAAHLAISGMIVVAPNHPGTTSRDSDPHQTVKVWERPQDLSAILDFLQATPPAGLKPDFTRIAVLGFSIGGHSALGLSGVTLSKPAFVDYCARMGDQLECKWLRDGGVVFSDINQALYEQSNLDTRITTTIAIDPAWAPAMTQSSLEQMPLPTLLINLGASGTVPEAVQADRIATHLPNARQEWVDGASHFSFLAECSTLGWIIIGIVGEENICADPGGKKRGLAHRELKQIISQFLTELWQ